MGFSQYLKDTRGELHHVAWPTRMDTIVYTVLVITISVGVSLYLGLFDFLFTSGLTRALNITSPQPAAQAQNIEATSSSSTIPVSVEPVSAQGASTSIPLIK
jgi:preprotein translocase SecE subunit